MRVLENNCDASNNVNSLHCTQTYQEFIVMLKVHIVVYILSDDMKKDSSIANMYRYVCMADDSSTVVQISCRIVKMTLLPLRRNLRQKH